MPIREVRLPVRPGRNMSAIIEIAARHELLREAGRDSAQSFIERIEKRLTSAESGAHHLPLAERLDRHVKLRSPARAQQHESGLPPGVSRSSGKDENR